MGIKNLHKFLRRHCPEIYVKKSLREYAYQKIAIDISVYLFTYKIIFGDQWLDAFIKLICCLRKNDIHCVFIYDGKAPSEKEIEKQKRRSSRDKQKEKIHEIETAIETFYQTNHVEEILLEIIKKKTSPMRQRLLKNTPKAFDIRICEKYLEKKKSQIVNLTDEDFKSSKSLFKILGIPYYISPSEGETMCAHLALDNKVYGVLSADTDILAYGTPKFLTKINTTEETVVEIKVENILNKLNLTQKQFTDFCILCGTDYNPNLFRVGPEKAYKLMAEFKSIDDIKIHDISSLNHIRVRELFSALPINFNIPFCKKPNYESLKGFLFHNNCKIHISTIIDAFKPKKLEFS